MVIAHLADLHLGRKALSATDADGVNQREQDLYTVLEQTTKYLVEEVQPDVVVIAGDVYDKTVAPIRAQHAMFAACAQFREAGIEMLMIGGNHDTPEAVNTMPALTLLSGYAGVQLASLEYQTWDIGSLRFHALPYRLVARVAAGRAEYPVFDWRQDGGNVLIAHGYAPGGDIGDLPDPALLPTAITRDEHRWECICLGHIHTHQQLDEQGRMFYPGTLERLTWGDIDETPGMWIHHFDDDGSLQRSESVLIADIVPGFPRTMQQLHYDANGKDIDVVGREVQAFLLELPDIEGSLVQLTLDGVDDAFRSSTYSHQWEQAFLQAGGLHLETHSRSADIEQLLDAELSATPEQLHQAWAHYATNIERTDLVALGENILEEAGEEIPT